jgi:hypothetical protein
VYDKYDRKKTVHNFSHRENNRLLDYYKIISISRPILARANMGLDFVSGQYGCLISRCRKYAINSLIHGHFHIVLVVIPRFILTLDCVSGQYGGLGMINRPIWQSVISKSRKGYFPSVLRTSGNITFHNLIIMDINFS